MSDLDRGCDGLHLVSNSSSSYLYPPDIIVISNSILSIPGDLVVMTSYESLLSVTVNMFPGVEMLHQHQVSMSDNVVCRGRVPRFEYEHIVVVSVKVVADNLLRQSVAETLRLEVIMRVKISTGHGGGLDGDIGSKLNIFVDLEILIKVSLQS